MAPSHRSLLRAAAAIAVVAWALPAARADTPVHCLYNTTVGVWQLSMTPNPMGPGENCSAPWVATSEVKVALSPPNVATVVASSAAEAAAAAAAGLPAGSTGTFTMVYDEGFALDIGGKSFWAFFKYEMVNTTAVRSLCNETFSGWYHDQPTKPGVQPANWGCYKAHKAAEHDALGAAAVRPLHPSSGGRLPTWHDHVLQRDDDFAARLNKATAGAWTASAKPTMGAGRTLGSLFGGEGVPSPPPVDPTPRHLRHGLSASERAAVAARDAAIMARLPTAWDWGNQTGVGGVSMLGPMRDQGDCGSCYAFGSTNSLNARLRIATKGAATWLFSPQDLVSCSQYSHGCNGGFPYLVAKYGIDYGIVDELCMPYESGIMPTPTCASWMCKAPAHKTFVDYTTAEYVGGYYGASTEALMMADIYANGPLAVSMEVYEDLLHYTSGIYRHVPSVAKRRSHSGAPEPAPFQLTNHIVLIVGWDVDAATGTKAWRVMNSWGHHFGEAGFFRIVRGVDECAIESMAVTMRPVV